MSETIKQAVGRARGKVYVLLDREYSDGQKQVRLAVSKPEARRIIDAAPKGYQPSPTWEGEDLVLQPNCFFIAGL